MLTLDASPAAWPLLPLLAATALAAVSDWRTGHIPNWLTFGAVVSGCLGHVLFGLVESGGRGAATAGLSCLVGLLVSAATPLLLYRCRAMGGGDVKLLAAVGALCWTSGGIEVELYAFVIASVFAGGRLAYRGKLWGTLRRVGLLLLGRVRPPCATACTSTGAFQEMRFAPSVFAAACWYATLQWFGAC